MRAPVDYVAETIYHAWRETVRGLKASWGQLTPAQRAMWVRVASIAVGDFRADGYIITDARLPGQKPSSKPRTREEIYGPTPVAKP